MKTLNEEYTIANKADLVTVLKTVKMITVDKVLNAHIASFLLHNKKYDYGFFSIDNDEADTESATYTYTCKNKEIGDMHYCDFDDLVNFEDEKNWTFTAHLNAKIDSILKIKKFINTISSYKLTANEQEELKTVVKTVAAAAIDEIEARIEEKDFRKFISDYTQTFETDVRNFTEELFDDAVFQTGVDSFEEKIFDKRFAKEQIFIDFDDEYNFRDSAFCDSAAHIDCCDAKCDFDDLVVSAIEAFEEAEQEQRQS